MDQHLDVSLMQKGAALFVGEHDFRAFTNNRKVKTPLKTIEQLTVEESECEITITMTANQFLLNMERFIVGTLIEIGLGQKEPDTITKAFNSYNEKYVGHKSMAGGLCLQNETHRIS
jgi:tRNA pseudouridine38-40 synthase